MTIITALFSDFLPYIAGAVALLAGLVGWGAKKKRDGRKQAENKAREEDHAKAADIRNRVDDADNVLHKFDNSGFRD